MLLSRRALSPQQIGVLGPPILWFCIYRIVSQDLRRAPLAGWHHARGEIVHKEQSHAGEHTSIIDQPLWDAVQAQLAGNAAERNASARHRQPSLLAGLLFDGDGNRMTPSHAVKKGTRYRYYVSGSLITKDRTENAAALRIPAAEIEQLVRALSR